MSHCLSEFSKIYYVDFLSAPDTLWSTKFRTQWTDDLDWYGTGTVFGTPDEAQSCGERLVEMANRWVIDNSIDQSFKQGDTVWSVRFHRSPYHCDGITWHEGVGCRQFQDWKATGALFKSKNDAHECALHMIRQLKEKQND